MTDPNVIPGGGAEHDTSVSLLERAKVRDEAAWRQLTLLYEPLLTRWCQHYRLQPNVSADIAQEVFLAVWQNLAEFQRDPPRWTFRKWLRTITRNKIIDCWHKEGARSGKAEGGSEAQTRLAELPADEEEEEGRISEETGFLYQRALQLIESSFQPGTIQAFLLYAVEGLAVETVAQRLQISVNTVYLARSRVAKKIRTEFGDVLEVETPLQPPAQKSSQDIVP